MGTYKNKFYNPQINTSKPIIETDSTPVEYKGYLIYHRIKNNGKWGDIFDIVKNGECVGMYAGMNGAKQKIDSYDN
jgi:hypothetical protein